MNILAIKTIGESSDLVIENKVYYSNSIPAQEFDSVLIIGKSEDGEIPVLAECSAITIDTCGVVDPAFAYLDREWKYGWSLEINKTFDLGVNILNYIDPSSASYRSVKHCQVFAYINPGDLIKDIVTDEKIMYTLTTEAQKLSGVNSNRRRTALRTIIIPVNEIVPASKIYEVGEIVEVKTKRNTTITNHSVQIIEIEKRTETDPDGNEILVDQKLVIRFKNGKTKIYLASKI